MIMQNAKLGDSRIYREAAFDAAERYLNFAFLFLHFTFER